MWGARGESAPGRRSVASAACIKGRADASRRLRRPPLRWRRFVGFALGWIVRADPPCPANISRNIDRLLRRLCAPNATACDSSRTARKAPSPPTAFAPPPRTLDAPGPADSSAAKSTSSKPSAPSAPSERPVCPFAFASVTARGTYTISSPLAHPLAMAAATSRVSDRLGSRSQPLPRRLPRSSSPSALDTTTPLSARAAARCATPPSTRMGGASSGRSSSDSDPAGARVSRASPSRRRTAGHRRRIPAGSSPARRRPSPRPTRSVCEGWVRRASARRPFGRGPPADATRPRPRFASSDAARPESGSPEAKRRREGLGGGGGGGTYARIRAHSITRATRARWEDPREVAPCARAEGARAPAGWVRGTTRNPPDPGARPDLLALLATLLALLAVRHLTTSTLSIATSSRGGSDELSSDPGRGSCGDTPSGTSRGALPPPPRGNNTPSRLPASPNAVSSSAA